ncbi:hypothetical protein IW261DRAFT_1461831, partial [Armillaria novae-zelandiae]
MLGMAYLCLYVAACMGSMTLSPTFVIDSNFGTSCATPCMGRGLSLRCWSIIASTFAIRIAYVLIHAQVPHL